jgi:hypothetical protein
MQIEACDPGSLDACLLADELSAALAAIESELMTQYGVSRITVRQALGNLEKERLIVKVPGKGSTLSPSPNPSSHWPPAGLCRSHGRAGA